MVWIVWGTKSRDVCIGKVADYCPFCDSNQVFLVTDHYAAKHFQYIRTEDWGMVGSSRLCNHCKNELVCENSAYSGFLDPNENVSFELLLHKTNSRLATRVKKQAADELGKAVANWREVPANFVTDPEFE